MKIIRVLFTIIFAILLFPTIWLSLQSTVVYFTLYDVEFIREVGRESDLSEQIIDSTVETIIELIENNELELPVDIDEAALLDEVLYHLDRVALATMIDDFSFGIHQFLFTDKDTLPIIDTHYLQDLGELVISLVSEQLLESLSNSTSELSSELLSQLNTETIDNNALETMINQQLPTIEIPETLDINQLTALVYASEVNPINSAKMITYKLPQYFLWILGSLLLGIPLLYLIINRFRFIATLQFFALTGLIATLFNLIGTVLLYWFFPNASHQVTAILGSDMPMVDSSVDFLNILTSQILSKAIIINLFVLISFIVILILTEVKKKLYPTKESIDTSKEALLQIVGTLLIAILIGFFVNNQWQKADQTLNDYQQILTRFDNHTIDIEPQTLLESLAN